MPTLYKYQGWNEYAKKTLTNDTIYLASPLEFNDPFDCRIFPSLEVSDDEFRSYLRRPLKRKNPNWSESDITREIEKLLKKGIHNTPAFRDRIRQDMIDMHQSTGILCLSGVSDNILMWSHYSNCHKGICFQINHNDHDNTYVLPINYQDRYPDFSIGDPDIRDIIATNCLRTKSTDWKYENEFRIVVPEGHGEHKLGVLNLSMTGVILGCRISEEDKNEIIKIAKERSISVMQSVASEDTFSLKINNI